MLSEKYKNFIFSSWFSYLLIILAGSLIYFKSLFFNFTYLDDNVWILDYQWFLKNIRNVFHLFTHPDFISKSFYRPVLNLSFMLDAQWSGESPFGYRLSDLGIHLISSCLLLNILKRLKYSKDLALSFALIFTAHPVFTQAVAWIPGRTDSLLGLFVLASFIFFLVFLERKEWQYYLGHVFFLILSLLTKETAVALPVMCFLYLFLIDEGKEPKSKYCISWFIILAVWGIIRTKIVMATNDITLSHAVISLFQNLPALIPYIGKIILPFNLSVLPILEDIKFTYGWISIGIISLLLIFSRQKRWRYIFFGFLWFLLFLLPSLVVSFLKHEYRLYLPIIGFMIILLETDLIKNLAANKRVFFICNVIILGLFGGMTFRYSHNFSDRLTFWHSAVKTSPNSPLAHRNLGAMYHLEGKLDKAIAPYKESLMLNPYEPMAHNNLGLIYANKGQLIKAEREYKAEIAVNPLYSNVYFNLGILYYDQGKFELAERAWKKTLELDPKYINAYKMLASYYVNRQDFKQAEYYVGQLKKRGIPVPEKIDQLMKEKN